MDNGLSGMSGALFIAITAFVVVFLILGAMALFMKGLGWSVTKAEKIQAGRLARATPKAPAKADGEPVIAGDGVDDETIAAVTAAVSMMMNNQRFRVAEIRQTDDGKAPWASAGHGNVPDSDNRWSDR